MKKKATLDILFPSNEDVRLEDAPGQDDEWGEQNDAEVDAYVEEQQFER